MLIILKNFNMKVSELRTMLKGLKGTDDIMISIPTKGVTYVYSQFFIFKDDQWKCYKIQVNETN